MKSRLKKLLRHVFYWDSPAQGAFFGLTLAIVGAWLLLSLFHFFWTRGAFGWIGCRCGMIAVLLGQLRHSWMLRQSCCSIP